MTTETIEKTEGQQQQAGAEQSTPAQIKADLKAGFKAGFDGQETVPEPKAKTPKEEATEPAKDAKAPDADGKAAKQEPKPKDKQPAATPPAAPTVEEIVALRAKAAEADTAKTELRKAQGRIGSLSSDLEALKKTKEAEGKPVALTPLELKGMKEQYPELADVLGADLAATLAGLTGNKADPEALQKSVDAAAKKLVDAQMATLRQQTVAEKHPTWIEDLWGDGKARTPDYEAWLKTMPADEAQTLESSENPYYVRGQLDKFYEWRDKAAKTKQESEQRLASAVQPKGAQRPAGQPTMSDREALRSGFKIGFEGT